MGLRQGVLGSVVGIAALAVTLGSCTGLLAPPVEAPGPADVIPTTYDDAFPAQYVTTVQRQGARQPFLLLRPQNPVASVILFTGGNGLVGISSGGVQRGGNFLVRTRRLFGRQGFLVAVVDPPSDRNNLDGFRTSQAHAIDIKGVIAYLRQQAPVPVWLVGTSYGTVSALKITDWLADGGGPDGVVITSSLFVRGRAGDSVYDANPDRIRVPLLMVHNRSDRCPSTPFHIAPGFLERFTSTPTKELIPFEGGGPVRGDVCDAFDYHGYPGLEQQVVDAIGRWIKAHPPK